MFLSVHNQHIGLFSMWCRDKAYLNLYICLIATMVVINQLSKTGKHLFVF